MRDERSARGALRRGRLRRIGALLRGERAEVPDLLAARPGAERGQGVLARLGLGPEHESWMMMSGLVALCVLLAVAVVVLPLFGARVAVVTAVIAVLGILVMCYIICVSRAFLRRRPATPRVGMGTGVSTEPW